MNNFIAITVSILIALAMCVAVAIVCSTAIRRRDWTSLIIIIVSLTIGLIVALKK